MVLRMVPKRLPPILNYFLFHRYHEMKWTTGTGMESFIQCYISLRSHILRVGVKLRYWFSTSLCNPHESKMSEEWSGGRLRGTWEWRQRWLYTKLERVNVESINARMGSFWTGLCHKIVMKVPRNRSLCQEICCVCKVREEGVAYESTRVVKECQDRGWCRYGLPL